VNDRGIRQFFTPVVWKLAVPPRIHIFLWLVANNKILTRDNLAKRKIVDDKTCLFLWGTWNCESLTFWMLYCHVDLDEYIRDHRCCSRPKTLSQWPDCGYTIKIWNVLMSVMPLWYGLFEKWGIVFVFRRDNGWEWAVWSVDVQEQSETGACCWTQEKHGSWCCGRKSWTEEA
jgi:hypothetical protein